MNKSVLRKIAVVVFLISAVGIVSTYYAVKNEYTKVSAKIAGQSDFGILLSSRYDKITKVLSETKFESVGPIEFDKMFKEHGTTYDNRIAWNVLRVQHSQDTSNLYLGLINDSDTGEGLIYLEKEGVDKNTNRNGIVPLEHKEIISTFKKGDLVHASWKNFRLDKHSGVSVLDSIRKASPEEIIQYLEVERKFDEEAYGPYEEPDFKRLLYKLSTHKFEEVGGISYDNLSHHCATENNYKINWTLVNYKEPFKEGVKITNIKNKDRFSDSCYFITPEIFRTEDTPSCLVSPELESTIKNLPPGTTVHTSWKNVRIHKNYCFYVLHEVRLPTSDEFTKYESIFTSGSSDKVGRFAKYYE